MKQGSLAMKINGLKKIITELNQGISENTDKEEMFGFLSRLTKLALPFNDEDLVTEQLRLELNKILDEFWLWVTENLPCEEWKDSEEIKPWLNFQKRLAAEKSEVAIKAIEDLQKQRLDFYAFLKNFEPRLEELDRESETLKQGIQKLNDIQLTKESEVKTTESQEEKISPASLTRSYNELVRLLDNIKQGYKREENNLLAYQQGLNLTEQQELHPRTLNTAVEKLEPPQIQLRLAKQLAKTKELYNELDKAIDNHSEKESRLVKLTFSNLLAANYHHDILYQALTKRYAKAGTGKLELNLLMTLFVNCARAMSYASKQEIEEGTYPLLRLQSKISRLRSDRDFEVSRIADQFALLTTSFYLIHSHCTPEQLALLPFLIHFRLPTTKEEQASEDLIVKFLINQAWDFKLFFDAQHQRFLNSNSFSNIPSLIAVKKLIPTVGNNFIKVLHKMEWIFLVKQINFQKAPKSHPLVETLCQIFERDFSKQNDHSYDALLSYQSKIRLQDFGLNAEEKKLLRSGLHLFCLGQYEKLRRGEQSKLYSGWIFSEGTKCGAAAKKQKWVRAEQVVLGFWEKRAGKQGRLGHLNAIFEEGDKEEIARQSQI